MPNIDVAKVVASDATTSDKIRTLAGAGYERAEIARLLGKRYQHVRNVLEGDRVRTRPSTRRSGVAPHTRSVGPNRPARLVVGADGSLVLPRELVAAMNLNPGDVAIGRLDGMELSVVSGSLALQRAQALVQSIVPPGFSLVDDLLADRRREGEAD